MRLLYTLNDQKKGHQISAILTAEGIENQLEISRNSDWGSPNYGDVTCKIWIYDEDKVDTATRWLELFEADPNHQAFQKIPERPLIFPEPPSKKLSSNKQIQKTAEKTGIVTFYIMLICCILFILDMMTTPIISEANLPAQLPLTPILSSPIKKEMYYDYPKAFTFIDRLVKLYGIEKLHTPQDLPSEGQYLLEQFYKTPYWQGIYPIAVQKLRDPTSTIAVAPLFEKISQGEVWRLFTPCLLHNDILHILFNVLWLILLGKQIEQRLGTARYIFFIFVTGIFSNTCQYLMSGSNFIGFSGILCAMLTFIWMRQRVAAWEGYPLPKATITFMMFFIFAVFFLQLISFYFETQQQTSFSPGIANTAHLSGALIGAILGRFSFFSWKA